MNGRIFIVTALILFFVPAAFSQTGGITLEKSVIATGSGSSSGGAFTVLGTIGQSAPDTVQNGQFTIYGGFLTPDYQPTAAGVTVSGRVFTPDGRSLMNALVLFSCASGETRAARTGAFGYYRFDDVAAGQTGIFQISSKRYRFNPQVISVTENVTELNFTAER